MDAVATGARRAAAPVRFGRDVVCVLGLPFDTLGLAAVVESLRAAALSNTRCFVSTANLNFLVAAQKDPAFRDSILRSDLSLPDGAPIVRVARLLGLPIVERVAGASVFEALRAHPGRPLRVFFFGGPPGVAERACRKLNERPGGLVGVGHDEAGFGDLDMMSTPDRIATINDSGADFVVVALGARKGQAWIERNAPRLQAPLLCHLGAVVNFVAGDVRRAPVWLQQAGLEWAWRIVEEPLLWRRYLGDGAAFLRLLATSVVPTWWARRRASRSGMPSTLHVAREGRGVSVMRLGGAWGRGVLGPLRTALAQAADRGDRVVLQMGRLQAVDAAFIGLLLLARGEWGGEGLRLHDATPEVRASMRRQGVDFLFDASPSAPGS